MFINYLEISAQPAVLNKGWLEKYKNVLEGPWSVPKMFPVSHKVENNWLHRPTAKQIILKELKKKVSKNSGNIPTIKKGRDFEMS